MSQGSQAISLLRVNFFDADADTSSTTCKAVKGAAVIVFRDSTALAARGV